MDQFGARHPAARSDVVRAHILATQGGVWADASVFCVTPLDDWVQEAAGSGFFAFRSPGYGRPLSTWFLAASERSVVMEQWSARVAEYWTGRHDPDAYFWFHHLFADEYASSATFREEWDSAVRTSSEGPHYFAPYGRRFTGRMSRRSAARLSARLDPVYKLTTRVGASVHPDSACAYFQDGGSRGLTSSREALFADRALHGVYVHAKASFNGARALRDQLLTRRRS